MMAKPLRPGHATRIEVATRIRAPPERCFDLARSVDLHLRSAAHTAERATGGVTRGLLGPGDRVTWSARHLGMRRTLTAAMTTYHRPHLFVDEMIEGPFRAFRHAHHFQPQHDGSTLMRDVFEFEAPLGLLGRVASRLVVEDHLRRFKEHQARCLKRAAETDEWREYLPA